MKVGIFGCGGFAPVHIAHIRRLGANIVGVCDPNEERGHSLAQRYGIPHVFRDGEQLLGEMRPDVVHIVTPPDTHKEVSIQAMEAGCHVLVEKPMALCVKEADEMIAAARYYQTTLCVCHNALFSPAMMEAKALVAQGAIGQVVSVDSYSRTFYNWQDGRLRATPWLFTLPGGIFHEVAPHLVYVLLEFLPTLRVVSAITSKTLDDLPTPADELRILFEGVSGLGAATITISASPYIQFTNLYGTRMTLQVNQTNNTLVKLRRDGVGKISKALMNLDQSLQLMCRTVTNTLGALMGRRMLGHGVLFRRFYKSIRQRTDPPVTGEDGKAVVAVLDQVWSALDATSSQQEGS